MLERELDKDEDIAVNPKKKAQLMKVKWRAYGAIRKLHKVVKYIWCTPQRRQAFATVEVDMRELRDVVSKISIMDNDTRWASVMMMIERALEQWKRIEFYCQMAQEDLAADILTKQDWEDLGMVTIPLAAFNTDTTDYETALTFQTIDNQGTTKERATRFNWKCFVGFWYPSWTTQKGTRGMCRASNGGIGLGRSYNCMVKLWGERVGE
jgi:hypothetical protein